MNHPRIDLSTNSITFPDGHRTRVVTHKMPVERTPQVVVFDAFLTDAECDALIELAQDRLSPAEVVSSKTGDGFVSPARVADMVAFDGAGHELTRRIEARIEALTHWPADHYQDIQIVRYGVGGQYKPHHDCYNPDMPAFKNILEINGQRLATFLMYLNDCPGSGATAFPRLDGLFVCPQKGSALFFCYPPHADGTPDTSCLHAAGPVFQGEKWIATTWLCERRGPASTPIKF